MNKATQNSTEVYTALKVGSSVGCQVSRWAREGRLMNGQIWSRETVTDYSTITVYLGQYSPIVQHNNSVFGAVQSNSAAQ